LMLIIYRLQQHHLTYLCIPFTHCIKKNLPVFRKYGVRQFIKKVEEDILS